MPSIPEGRIRLALVVVGVFFSALWNGAYAQTAVRVTIFIPESHTGAGVPALAQQTAHILMKQLNKRDALSADIAPLSSDNRSAAGPSLGKKCVLARSRGSSHLITGSITQSPAGVRCDLFVVNAHKSTDSHHFYIQHYKPSTAEAQMKPVSDNIGRLLSDYRTAPSPAETPADAQEPAPEKPDKLQPCFMIHAGSYKNRTNAVREASRFQQQGLAASVKHVDLESSGVWFRVYVGAYTDRRKAQQVQQLLEQKYNAQTRLLPCR